MTRSHPHHHQGHNHSHSNNQREEADEKVPVTPRKVVVYTDNLMTSMGARNAITGNTSSDLIHSLADTLNTALVISTSFRFDPELNMLEILDPYNTRNHVVVKGLVNYTVSAKLFFLSAGMDASNQPSVVYIKQALTSVYNQLGEVPIDELYVSFADAETTHDLAATTASSSYSSESENNGDGNSQCTRDTSSISRYVNVWKALNQYKAEGDICKLGICDMTPQQIDQLMEVSEEAGPDMVQVQVGNDPDIASSLDPDMVMYAEKRGISINCHRDNPTLLTDRTFQVLASDFKINERFPTTEVPRKGYRIDFMRPRWVVNYSVTLRDRGIVVNRGYIVMASSDNVRDPNLASQWSNSGF